MSYKSLTESIADIAKSTRIVKGKEYAQWGVYLGTNAVDGRPKRMWASTREKLESDLRAFYKTIRRGGEMMAILTPTQIADAKSALDALAAAKVSLSLLECAKRVVGQISASQCTMTVAECYAKYIAEKHTSKADIGATNQRTGRWASVAGRERIVDVTSESILEYLAEEMDGLSPKTWNNHFKYIDTFLNWCAKKPRCWIPESPLAYVDAKTEAWHEPECITPKDARLLFSCIDSAELRAAHPEFIAYAALSFFCGIRREEILRIAEGERSGERSAIINLENGAVSILKPKGFLKGVKPRSFQMHPTAVAWLKTIDLPSALKLVNQHITKRMYKFARRTGAVIPRNCGRHSFITYHVCAYENLAKTLMIAGTSEGMSEDHYRALKTRAEGEEYFSIVPGAVRD